MEAKHSEGVVLTISVWTSHIRSSEGDRCIVVMEPVQKIAANVSVSFDVSGNYFLRAVCNSITLRILTDC